MGRKEVGNKVKITTYRDGEPSTTVFAVPNVVRTVVGMLRREPGVTDVKVGDTDDKGARASWDKKR